MLYVVVGVVSLAIGLAVSYFLSNSTLNKKFGNAKETAEKTLKEAEEKALALTREAEDKARSMKREAEESEAKEEALKIKTDS